MANWTENDLMEIEGSGNPRIIFKGSRELAGKAADDFNEQEIQREYFVLAAGYISDKPFDYVRRNGEDAPFSATQSRVKCRFFARTEQYDGCYITLIDSKRVKP